MNLPRKVRSDAGVLQITDRDVYALSWISEQYCISFDHLRRLLGGNNAKAATKDQNMLSPSATYNAIYRWLNMDLIEQPRKIVAGHSVYIWLSRKGITQLGLPFTYYTPKPSTIKHIYAVNAIRLQFDKNDIPAKWYSARTVTKMSDVKPVPDAEIRQQDGTIAVKVIERSELLDITLHEESAAIVNLAERYTKVWCFSPKGALEAIKQRLVNVQPEAQRHMTFYELQAPQNIKVQH